MKKILLLLQASILFITANGQWKQQDANIINDTLGFYEMSLPNARTVWAVCYDGKFGLLGGRPVNTFVRTTNGGKLWKPGTVSIDRSLRFSNISAIDGKEAYVAVHKMDYSTAPQGFIGFGKGGGVYHTDDEGITWNQVNPGELFNANSTPQFVHFKDKNHGIAVGDPNQGYWEIYLTDNKGKKWKRVSSDKIPAPLPNERGWISGYAAIGNTIWFGTSAGRMYKSKNFGKTWSVHVVDSIQGAGVNEIAFLDNGLTGVAHLRNNTRTFVLSTTDGGLTWTNYFQPANWKNSRMTAVPGTNAFISTAVHGNPIFQGSAISYDAGQTWTELDNAFDKAVCRFYDCKTGYAGGFFLTGPPRRGGIFKSEIVFETAARPGNAVVADKAKVEEEKNSFDSYAKVFPVPASNVLHVTLQDAIVNEKTVIRILSMDGKVIQTMQSQNEKMVQFKLDGMSPGTYMLQIDSKGKLSGRLFSVIR